MIEVPHRGNVEHRPIGSITPSNDNPRQITNAAVEIAAKSLREFGWQQPIVVDTTGEIIAGHTRTAPLNHSA